MLIAYASWQPHPGRLEPRQVTGWAAIALPLAAQALAAGIQVYGFFHEIPRSERVLTLSRAADRDGPDRRDQAPRSRDGSPAPLSAASHHQEVP